MKRRGQQRTSASSERVVQMLPLTELWQGGKVLQARRKHALTAADIRERLRAAPVQFVVANVGERLRWIEPAGCHRFWKKEVVAHLCKGERGYLEEYPGGYFYWAYLWELESGGNVIVLEMSH